MHSPYCVRGLASGIRRCGRCRARSSTGHRQNRGRAGGICLSPPQHEAEIGRMLEQALYLLEVTSTWVKVRRRKVRFNRLKRRWHDEEGRLVFYMLVCSGRHGAPSKAKSSTIQTMCGEEAKLQCVGGPFPWYCALARHRGHLTEGKNTTGSGS